MSKYQNNMLVICIDRIESQKYCVLDSFNVRVEPKTLGN